MKIEKIFENIEKLYDSCKSEEKKESKKEEIQEEILRKIDKTKKELSCCKIKKEQVKLEKKLKILKKLFKKVK